MQIDPTVSAAAKAFNVQQLMGYDQRGTFLGPKRFNSVTYNTAVAPNGSFDIRLKSAGSLVDLDKAFVEFQVVGADLSTAAKQYCYKNVFQFLVGTNVRIANHDLKYRSPESMLHVAATQPDFDKYRSILGMNVYQGPRDDAEAPATDVNTPTLSYISTLNSLPKVGAAGLIPFRVPLIVLFPELRAQQSANSIWVDNESGVQLQFRAGYNNGILNLTDQLNAAVPWTHIQAIRLVYLEQYPTNEMMDAIKTTSIPLSFPFFDVMASSELNGNFSYSLAKNESYRKLTICAVMAQNTISGTRTDAILNTYSALLTADKSPIRVNTACLPLEFSEISINWPQQGKYTISRDQMMSLHIMNSHYRCLADQIFLWIAEIDLMSLPFERDLDFPIIHGAEVRDSHQLNIQYKIITTPIGQHSVPYYGADVGPTGLGNCVVQCILHGSRDLILKNGHYRSA